MKDDMAAVLGGLRDERAELVQLLEMDSAAAAKLAARGADAAVEVGRTCLRPSVSTTLQTWFRVGVASPGRRAERIS